MLEKLVCSYEQWIAAYQFGIIVKISGHETKMKSNGSGDREI